MNNDDTISEILELLVEKTRRAEIDWRATLPPDSFITSFPSHSVKVGLDRKNSSPVLVVYDGHGGIISETSSAIPLSDIGSRHTPLSDRVMQLYNLVRASKNSELDKLLEELREAS